MAMWGGRFQEASLDEFRAFNDSLAFDYLLAQQDIAASRSWAIGLAEAGIITAEEAALLDGALAELATEVEANPELPLQTQEEVQAELREERVPAIRLPSTMMKNRPMLMALAVPACWRMPKSCCKPASKRHSKLSCKRASGR